MCAVTVKNNLNIRIGSDTKLILPLPTRDFEQRTHSLFVLTSCKLKFLPIDSFFLLILYIQSSSSYIFQM